MFVVCFEISAMPSLNLLSRNLREWWPQIEIPKHFAQFQGFAIFLVTRSVLSFFWFLVWVCFGCGLVMVFSFCVPLFLQAFRAETLVDGLPCVSTFVAFSFNSVCGLFARSFFAKRSASPPGGGQVALPPALSSQIFVVGADFIACGAAARLEAGAAAAPESNSPQRFFFF